MDRNERINDPEEALRLAMEAHQARLWTAIPGIVVAVNLTAQTLSVQPAIQGSISNAAGDVESVNLPLLVDVPICFPRAGGFALTFPIAVNDEVLVVFSARCMDSWWQNGGVQAPAEVRMHDLSDGFALLAPTSQPKKLSAVSSSNVQLRNNAGDTFVEITPAGSVRVIASASIAIEAPSVSIDADTINLNGQVNQTNGSFVIGGVTFGTHKHTGVQTGGGTSGGPTN